jgi:hypothetical protein
MTVHELKTWAPYYRQVATGEKPFEIRRNDRDYRAGDALVLREYEPKSGRYSRGCLIVIVTCLVDAHSLSWPFLQPGVVVMGLRKSTLREKMNVIRLLLAVEPSWKPTIRETVTTVGLAPGARP